MDNNNFFEPDATGSFLSTTAINCDTASALYKVRTNYNAESAIKTMKESSNQIKQTTIAVTNTATSTAIGVVPTPQISPYSETSEPDCVREEFADSVWPASAAPATPNNDGKSSALDYYSSPDNSTATTVDDEDGNDNCDDIGDDDDGDESSNDSSSWPPRSMCQFKWLQEQHRAGLLPSLSGIGDSGSFWQLLSSLMPTAPPGPHRRKLPNVNTFEDVITLLRSSQKIIVLTGAGVSVSCGIPDFRSSNGVYSRLAKDYPDLPNPQAMFDIDYFSRDPRPFFKFAREIYPGQFKPSPCHRFIKLLETKGKLLRNYSQNIDTLERVAGIENVIECHGSFSTASCTKCKHRCSADIIRDDIMAQRIPVCPHCQPCVQQSVAASDSVSPEELKQLVVSGIMKPDIVFFGEGLPDEFHESMAKDKNDCDLLIVIGSSLKVRPVATIPNSIPAQVPQVLINREQLNMVFDVELLGDSDVIVNQLCHRLGEDWSQICFDDVVLSECKDLLPIGDVDTQSNATNSGSDSGFEGSSPNNCTCPRMEETDVCSCATTMRARQTQHSSDLTAVTASAPTPSPTSSAAPPRTGSIAESLLPGTYYCHKNNHSFVFPGAQVPFQGGYNDDDEDEEDDDDDDGADSFDSVEQADFGSSVNNIDDYPISPFLHALDSSELDAPSFDYKSLAATTTTCTATTTCITVTPPTNQHLAGVAAGEITNPATTTTAPAPAPPPSKRQRISVDHIEDFDLQPRDLSEKFYMDSSNLT